MRKAADPLGDSLCVQTVLPSWSGLSRGCTSVRMNARLYGRRSGKAGGDCCGRAVFQAAVSNVRLGGVARTWSSSA